MESESAGWGCGALGSAGSSSGSIIGVLAEEAGYKGVVTYLLSVGPEGSPP